MSVTVTRELLEAAIQDGRAIQYLGGRLGWNEIDPDFLWSGHVDADVPEPGADLALLDAAVLRSVLVEYDEHNADRPRFDPRGLNLCRIRVVGSLDLNFLTLPFPLHFSGCALEDWFWADHATLPRLDFDRCLLSGVVASGSRIETSLGISGCRQGPRGAQVFLEGAHLGQFSCRPDSFADGPERVRLVLDGATVDHLVVGGPWDEELDPSSLFPLAETSELTIGRLTLDAGKTGGRSRAEFVSAWLTGPETGATPTFRPQVWSAFAEALHRSGDGPGEHARRDLLIESERAKTRTYRTPLRQLRRLAFEPTVAYGYRNGLALAWLVAAYVVTVAVVWANREDFLSTGSASEMGGYPGLWPIIYAFDIVVSPLGTGQSDAWWVGASFALALTLILLKLFSWMMLGLFVSGVTGIISRR